MIEFNFLCYSYLFLHSEFKGILKLCVPIDIIFNYVTHPYQRFLRKKKKKLLFSNVKSAASLLSI